MDDKNLNAKIIKHQISDSDLNKGYLTWKCRSLMEEQKNDYEYFCYLEHDIKFSEENLQYWLKYQDQLHKKNFHLGFLIYERNNLDNQKYSIHIVRKLNKYLKIEDKKFVINDLENYSCFWIYNKDQFHKFLRSKWWSFKKRAHNFRHNYGITERSSIGFHSFNMNYFKATLLPEIDNQPDPNCFVEHMTNNYYEKFSEFKNQNYMDIRGVCTLKIDEIFEDLKEVKDNFFLIKLFKLIKWKFRFITRKFN